MESLDAVLEYCDTDGNGNVDACEIHDCVLRYENEWRAENCPDYGMAYCENPFEPCAECEGAWTCSDIAAIS